MSEPKQKTNPIYNVSEQEFSLLSKFGWAMWIPMNPIISPKVKKIMVAENKWTENEAPTKQLLYTMPSILITGLSVLWLVLIILTSTNDVFPPEFNQLMNIPVILFGFIVTYVIGSVWMTKIYKPICNTIRIYAEKNKSEIPDLPQNILWICIGGTLVQFLMFIVASVVLYLNH